MWIKKTKEEIESEPKKKPRYSDSILAAVLVFLLVSLHYKTGFVRSGAFDSLTWGEFIYKIPLILLICGLTFSGFFLYQFYSGKNLRGEETTYICEKCNNKKLDDGKYKCECGGEFIHINLMKWVEDDENKDEKNTSAESD